MTAKQVVNPRVEVAMEMCALIPGSEADLKTLAAGAGMKLLGLEESKAWSYFEHIGLCTQTHSDLGVRLINVH